MTPSTIASADPSHRPLSRRTLLAALASTSAFGCRSRAAAPVAAGGSSGGGGWGGLDVETVGSLRADERGGAAVVLLHGWGAPGDDLVSLAQALVRPGVRFFMPVGLLPERGGGRAWWHLDSSDRPVHVGDDVNAEAAGGAGQPPHPRLLAARRAVQNVLRTIVERHAPERLMIGGFSQGAMLALDVALAAEPEVERVAALSGVFLADSLASLKAPRPRRPPVFVSHGRQDEILAFRGSERMRELLERHGHEVIWRPFDGGHDIPPAIVADLARFFFPDK